MSERLQSKREREKAVVKKVRKIPVILEHSIQFCLSFPPLMLFLVISGWWDSKLVGGQALKSLAEGSFSVVADVSVMTISILCLFIGNLLFYTSKKYMED